MYTLLLDTSSENLLIGFHEVEKPLVEQSISHNNKLSEILLPSVLSLLDKKNLLIQDIGRVAVGVGPGSYTGTRVGVSVAKALSFSRTIPLLSFCSLLCLIPDQQGPFAALLPAKSGQFFTLQGVKKDSLILEQKTALLRAEELETLLPTLSFLTSLSPLDSPLWVPPKISLRHTIAALTNTTSTTCKVRYLNA